LLPSPPQHIASAGRAERRASYRSMPTPEPTRPALKVSRPGEARSCSQSGAVSAPGPKAIRGLARGPARARALPAAAGFAHLQSVRRPKPQSRQSQLERRFGNSFTVILSDLHQFFQTKPGRDLRRYFGCGLALPGSPGCLASSMGTQVINSRN
jgi:hypothetical protein